MDGQVTASLIVDTLTDGSKAYGVRLQEGAWPPLDLDCTSQIQAEALLENIEEQAVGVEIAETPVQKTAGW